MHKIFIVFYSLFLITPVVGQIKTDLQNENYYGKIKSVVSFSVKNQNEKKQVYNFRKDFNENGMELKFINISQNSRFDSIIKSYDTQNNLIKKIEYRRSGNSITISHERFVDILLYEYSAKCKKPTLIKNPENTYKEIRKFDGNCDLISEIFINTDNETEKSTIFELDTKRRLVKKVVQEIGQKADLEETINYDEANNTITNVYISPVQDIYLMKRVTQLNEKKKVVEETTYQEGVEKNGYFFDRATSAVPKTIRQKIRFKYDKDRVISEIKFDHKNAEVYKLEYVYDEKGALKEEKIFDLGKIKYKKIYAYENDQLVNEKKFLPNKLKPEYIKKWNYNINGQITELVTIVEDGDQFLNIYLYDNFNNEIEEKFFENGKLTNTNFTKIEYYP